MACLILSHAWLAWVRQIQNESTNDSPIMLGSFPETKAAAGILHNVGWGTICRLVSGKNVGFSPQSTQQVLYVFYFAPVPPLLSVISFMQLLSDPLRSPVASMKVFLSLNLYSELFSLVPQ